MASTLPTAVENFQRYLRIKTVQPQPDYLACTQFLKLHAEELGLPCTVIEVKPGKPVVIITWEGKDPSLSSIGLNSHTDVVPVYRDHWTHDPFAAEIVTDDQGEQRIYARGTQDMKIVGWGYLEAIRNLKAAGHRFLRTVHLLFVPDEEIGSEEGMKVFVHQPEFKALNIGFMLDEGVANPDDAYYVFYAEKSAWWTRLRAEGQTGHGSQFIPNTAVSKLMPMLNTLLEFRAKEAKRLLDGGVNEDDQTPIRPGDVTSLNLTMLNGGTQVNVVPESIEANVDIRVTPRADFEEFRQWLESLAQKHDVKLEFIQYMANRNVTSLKDNPWWDIIQEASKELGITLDTGIFPGATDARFVRPAGIPVLGISPLRNTPILLHDNDEYVTVKTFLEAIAFYEKVISGLANNKP